MTEAMLVSLVAMVGWLLLISRSGQIRGLGWRHTVTVASIWAGIFTTVVLIVGMIHG